MRSFTKFREVGGEKLLSTLRELGKVLTDLSEAELEKVRDILSKCASEIMNVQRK